MKLFGKSAKSWQKEQMQNENVFEASLEMAFPNINLFREVF